MDVVTFEQYTNRLTEWFFSPDICEAYDVFEDLVYNGFRPDTAFWVTVDLFQDA